MSAAYGLVPEFSEWRGIGGRRGLVKVELTGQLPEAEQLHESVLYRIRVRWAELDLYDTGSRTIHLMGPWSRKPHDGIHVLFWNIGGEYATPNIPPLALELAARLEELAPPTWPPAVAW
jgi:hypothetical protein